MRAKSAPTLKPPAAPADGRPAHVGLLQRPYAPGSNLTRLLHRNNYHTTALPDPRALTRVLRNQQIDVAIAHRLNRDLLPELISICISNKIGVIVIDDPATTDVVSALDQGADDYLSSPPDPEELLARLRAFLRRHRPSSSQVETVTTDQFSLDLTNRRATAHTGEAVRLTPIEWRLIEILVRNPNRLIPTGTLLGTVWGPDRADRANYIRVHTSAIRKKLETDPSRPEYFRTDPGLGLRFTPNPAQPRLTIQAVPAPQLRQAPAH